MIVLYRENLTDFGKFLLYFPVALTYIALTLSFLLLKDLGFLTDDTLYDNSEELKVIMMKWKQWFSLHRLPYLGSSLLLIGVTAWFLMTAELRGNPFSNPILCYIYLSMMIILFFSISAYFASCKTIFPIKGRVALMVAG